MPYSAHGICVLGDLPGEDKEKRRFDRYSNRFLKKGGTDHNNPKACKPRHEGDAFHRGDDYPDFTENAQGGLVKRLLIPPVGAVESSPIGAAIIISISEVWTEAVAGPAISVRLILVHRP
ncbi:hypothetical protein SAMN05216403_10667 [Nitrosospira multiformis ATCC 25196]|uniref:Uncharacterized protein n=1 Tax=Nitrosospira multiformis (strain ATCC 25196 / NCIMB 11849 / C 71) TaxID=323848 RepID=A0A1H5U4G1_NITMU|nr:hypothetical protein SAMN05216403_10667 [Nitrosospira multiformis ATCC 25196]